MIGGSKVRLFASEVIAYNIKGGDIRGKLCPFLHAVARHPTTGKVQVFNSDLLKKQLEHIPIVGQQRTFPAAIKLLKIALVISDKVYVGIFLSQLGCSEYCKQLTSGDSLHSSRKITMQSPYFYCQEQFVY